VNGGGNPLKRNKNIISPETSLLILEGKTERVMRKSSQIKVSVIVPTYNRVGDLAPCLESIFKQDLDRFEVIVVDDASTDSTKRVLKKKGFFNKIVYLYNRKRLGVSKAKNRGIKAAKGKYCWFLDSDTKILSRKCLRFLYEASEKNSQIGSLGCEIIQRGNDCLIREHTFFGNDLTHPFGRREKKMKKNCDYLATCNCFVPTGLLKKIGGFNELYHLYGYEDAEMGKKILDLGYQNIIDSRAAVLHLRSSISRTANYRLFFKNRIRFAIWNFPFLQAIKLPVIDLRNFIGGIKMAKELPTEQIKGQASSKVNQIFGRAGMLLEYLFGLIYGYSWNLIFLPITLFLDKKRNFLKDD
jgi:GT2 family glycosyltransferase